MYAFLLCIFMDINKQPVFKESVMHIYKDIEQEIFKEFDTINSLSYQVKNIGASIYIKK